MEHCIIIDTTGADEWPRCFGECGRIPFDKRSTVVHPSRASAEAEARRLAEAHPGRTFEVFCSVVTSITVRQPTHTTLGGKDLFFDALVS